MEFINSYEATVVFRLFLAILFGGYIGAERIRKKRPAGIKTHAIVALGAALAMATNEYIVLQVSPNTDVARFAAQVISGIGFLGAGMIMITGRNQVTGLTTAAGLWLSACIGIAVGIGFYTGAIASMVMLWLIKNVFSKIDRAIQINSQIMNIMVDCMNPEVINLLNKLIINSGCTIISSSAQKHESLSGVDGVIPVKISIYMGRNVTHQDLMNKIVSFDGVIAAEEV